jgi:hypothetical protein
MKTILKKQSEIMSKYAFSLKPGVSRAQCYNISNYKLNPDETIADRVSRDHRTLSSSLRAAQLMVEAGCATEIPNEKPYVFGTFVFLDGSELRG